MSREGCDILWDAIELLLERFKRTRRGGSTLLPFRSFFSGILYLLKTGCQWDMIPKNHLSDQQRILTDSTIDVMQRVATAGTTPFQYGLGWSITENDYGYRRICHDGGMPGVVECLNLYPSENMAIVVLPSTKAAEVYRIAEESAATMLPKYAAAREERRKYEGSVPVTLLFQSDGDVHVKLGDQLRTLLNDISYRENNLIGTFTGTIPTGDQSRHHPRKVLLNVRLRDDKLSGQASALAIDEQVYYELTSYVELLKVKGPAACRK